MTDEEDFLNMPEDERHAILRYWQAVSRGEPGNIEGITPENPKRFIIDPAEKMMRHTKTQSEGAERFAR